MGHLADALIETCVKWANATGQCPVAITLPQAVYLSLAGELNVYHENGKWYAVYVAPSPPITMAEMAIRGFRTMVQDVRVVDHFVWNGPLGPVEVWADRWDE